VSTDLAAQHLSQALVFKTISHQRSADDDPNAFLGLRNWLKTTYPRVHATLKHELIPGGALLYRWQGTDATLLPIMFLAHQDVVPVEPGTEALWKQAAFAGTIAEGYVWGRGAIDDKGRLVTLMETAEALLASGFTPRRTIYFGLGSDEEVGGNRGARHIADVLVQRSIRLSWVLDEGSTIINDPANPPKLLARIGTGQKGYASIVLTATGQGGSSSMPPAKTAIDMLSRALVALSDQPFSAAPMARATASGCPPEKRATVVRAADSATRTTLVPTMLQSGVKDNVLPTIASATLNARILPGNTVEQLMAHIRGVVADCNINVTLTVGVNPPPLSATTTPGYQALTATMQRLASTIPVTTGMVNSTTDARHMTQVADAIYYFMPWILHEDDLPRIHGANERLSLTQLAFGIRFFSELISKQ
jgi:carboxypeptidase PM20D1